MKKTFLLTFAIVMSMSIHLHADLQEDINTLFYLIENSVNDSRLSELNALLLRYKRNTVQLGEILSATKVYSGIANTTPLHIAARGNLGITVLLLQKAAVVPWEGDFRYQIANAIDNADEKPINYAATTAIFNVLDPYTF